MPAEKLHFITEQLVPLIRTLAPGAAGKWGKMNAQQMTEHVAAFFKVSSGRLQMGLVTPEEHLPKYREFLRSEKEFRENTQAPLSIIGEEALPLRHATMEAAVADLERSIRDFVGHFAVDSNTITTHPVFGPLNFEDWVLLHYKHVRHHAKQFGLV